MIWLKFVTEMQCDWISQIQLVDRVGTTYADFVARPLPNEQKTDTCSVIRPEHVAIDVFTQNLWAPKSIISMEFSSYFLNYSTHSQLDIPLLDKQSIGLFADDRN